MDLKKISEFVPEFKNIFINRYLLLKFIMNNEPVGRRSLAKNFNISERNIRDEISFLKDMDAVYVSTKGISIKDKGRSLIKEFSDLYKTFSEDTNNISDDLKRILNLKEIYISKGDSTKDENAFVELAKLGASIAEKKLKDNLSIGITGGHTMSLLSEYIKSQNKNMTIIPARGSIGIRSTYQANTVASLLARNTNSESFMIPLPDTVDDETLKALIKRDDFKEIAKRIKAIDLLLFGIGRADTMARRRGLNKNLSKDILKKGGVGEAFGNFFSIEGKIILHQPSIGISMEDFLSINDAIAVAGGEEKAEAIIAISQLRKDLVLVIDEAAANKIKILGGK